MEKSQIKSHLQSFFDRSVVTIVGSGLSCAEGMPGMGDLGKELLLNVSDNISDKSRGLWNSIAKEIREGKGLEEVLLRNKPDEEIEKQIRKVTEQYMRKSEERVITSVFKKGNSLRFSEYIKKINISTKGTPIITTNYDRLLEFACENEGILVDNLFTGTYIGHKSNNEDLSFVKSFEKTGRKKRISFKNHVIIYKPHGCLGWYKKEDGQVIYSTFNLGLESLIITPGGNKYRKGYDYPFDVSRDKANEEIDKAECFVIIGYGFNDDHLQTHLIQKIKEGIPTLIISRDISDSVKKLIKSRNSTAVYYYQGKQEEGSIVNIGGECVYIKDSMIWDLGEFVKEVL